MIEIVPEEHKDRAALERVLDRAFGPGRHAKTSERVRENGAVFAPSLSRVARAEGEAIGCCRLWRIAIGETEALFLGPLAVDPERQHHGLGASLVRACLDAAAETAFDFVVLVGAPAFFAPLGFAPAAAGAILMPGPVDPGRLLVRALKDAPASALRGRVTAPRAASPASEE